MNDYKSIPRNEFFVYCKRAFESFRLSTYMTDRYLRYIEYISQYMEDMNIDYYDLNFSLAFQEKIAKADNSPNQRKSKEYSIILSTLLFTRYNLQITNRQRHNRMANCKL